jgi:RimJ/RimL family protein N-acetyltransferase
LVPGISGQGIGMHLIQAGCQWIVEQRLGVHVVDAEILSQNVASINVFERAGFKLHHLTYQKELL